MIRDPLHRRLPLPGQRHPARPHQPERPGAAELVSAADARLPAGHQQLDRHPGDVQQPAQGQHQDRLRAGQQPSHRRPAHVGAARLERSRAADACFRRSGTTRAGRWRRPTPARCRTSLINEFTFSWGSTKPVAVLRPAQLRLLSRRHRRAAVSDARASRHELSVPLPGHQARSRQAVEPVDSELQHAAQPVSRLLVRLRVPVVRQRHEDHGNHTFKAGVVGGALGHEGPDSAQRRAAPATTNQNGSFRFFDTTRRTAPATAPSNALLGPVRRLHGVRHQAA